MGQQGFEWGEQWGLEASRHSVHMWCGSSECARARGGGRGWSCGKMPCRARYDILGLPVRFTMTRVERLYGKRARG